MLLYNYWINKCIPFRCVWSSSNNINTHTHTHTVIYSINEMTKSHRYINGPVYVRMIYIIKLQMLTVVRRKFHTYKHIYTEQITWFYNRISAARLRDCRINDKLYCVYYMNTSKLKTLCCYWIDGNSIKWIVYFAIDWIDFHCDYA